MPSATIGKLNLILSATTKPFTSGLTALKSPINGVISGVGRMTRNLFSLRGAIFSLVGAGGFAALVKSQASAIDGLAKTASKLGTTTEALSRLGFAAEQTGNTQQQLNIGLQRMTRRIAEAAQGSGEAQGALRELGLDAKKLAQLPVDQQFAAIGDALEGVRAPTDRVRLGFKLFDSEGVGLINTLKGGSAALDQFGEQSDRIGNTVSSSGAKSVEGMNDAVNRMTKAFSGGFKNLTVAIAPTVTTIANLITTGIGSAGSYIGQVWAWVSERTAGLRAFLAANWQTIVTHIVGRLQSIWNIASTVFSAVASIVGSVMQYIGNVSGVSLGGIGEAFMWFQDMATTALYAVEFAVNNWQAVLQLAALKGATSVVRFGAQIRHAFTTVIPTVLSWFADNWKDIFKTIYNYTTTVFSNLASNIVNIISNLPGLITGSTDWSEVWTPLTEGFESAIKELPDIPPRQIGQLEASLQSEVDVMQGQLGQSLAEFIAGKDTDASKVASSITSSLGSFGSFLSQNDKSFDINTPDLPAIDTSALTDTSATDRGQSQGGALIQAGTAAAQVYAFNAQQNQLDRDRASVEKDNLKETTASRQALEKIDKTLTDRLPKLAAANL
ncbi:hypothetical protein HED60_19335 [Planctomycetales bacterium ZRK34]|nr:hypothetical protein HED60_19335 [Planctomycetales bacterium ZRK34]